jgi:TIR domain
MQLLSEIIIERYPGKSVVQLLQGDLTAIPKEHSSDILVISAFPNDYTPLPGSLMHALYQKGINVADMAKEKSVNLVPTLGCWLSKPLSAAQWQQFNFKQILCFEPDHKTGSPETAVGNIFRCINNFVFDDDNNVIAMPVLASGKQKIPMEKMLPAMLDACTFWLESGIPLDYIKLVVHSDEQARTAIPIFDQVKLSYTSSKLFPQDVPVKNLNINPTDEFVLPSEPARAPGHDPAPAAPPSPVIPAPGTIVKSEYDFFISYSHVHSQQVAALVNALKTKSSQFNIFYDRSSIPVGGLWIKLISDAIQKSKCVICILSPEYRNSDVCWDEFQCAKAKEYRTKKTVIKTINFFKDDEMPLIMSLYSYIDCTEGDLQKLKDAANILFV